MDKGDSGRVSPLRIGICAACSYSLVLIATAFLPETQGVALEAAER